MYTVYSWLDLTTAALKGLWVGFLNFVPSLLGAIVVFLVWSFCRQQYSATSRKKLLTF